MIRPKIIVLHVKDAHGRKQELIFEDVVFMEIIEPLREVVNKCLFVIDIDRHNELQYNTGIDIELPKGMFNG